MAFLSSMQRFTQTKFMQAALIVLALSFGAWGVTGYLTGGAQNVAIEVNGHEVSAQELSQDFARVRQQVEARTGEVLSPQQSAQMRLPQQVMRQRVQQVLLQDMVADLGVVAAPEAIKQDIQANATFAGEDGAFSAETYAATVAAYGVTPAQYETSVGDLMAMQTLQEALKVAPSEDYTRTQAQQQFAPVDVTLAELRPNDLPAPRANSETVLRNFYQARQGVYAMPEQRTGTRVVLSAAQALGDMADQLADALAGGQALSQAALTLGLPISELRDDRVTDLDGVTAEELTTLRSLAENGTAQIDLDTGETAWLQLTTITPEAPQPYEAVKRQVQQDWQATEQQRELANKVPAVLKAIRAKKGVQTALRENGLRRVQVQTLRNKSPDFLALENGVYGQQLQNLVAMMREGQAASFRAQGEDGAVFNVLVSLNKRHDYTPTAEELAQAKQTAEEAYQGVATSLLIQDLFAQANIGYKQSVLRRIFGVEAQMN